MSLKISYQNATTKEEAFNSVKNSINAETLEKFKVSADVDADDISKTIRAKGTGFKLDMVFYDDAVEIDLDLSMMLKPFKGKVLGTIESMVKKAI